MQRTGSRVNEFDPAAYRAADEVSAQRLQDPIVRVGERLRAWGATDGEIERVLDDARREMQAARDAARRAPLPAAAALLDDVQDVGAPAWR